MAGKMISEHDGVRDPAWWTRAEREAVARARSEDQLASPDRTDRPLYAWLVEDQVCTGDLPRWCQDYVMGHYSGIIVSTEVIRLVAVGYRVETVRKDVSIRHVHTDSDYLYYRAIVEELAAGNGPDSRHVITDAASFTIDGRA